MSSCGRVLRQIPLVRWVSRDSILVFHKYFDITFQWSRWPRWWGHNGYTLAYAHVEALFWRVIGQQFPNCEPGKAKPHIFIYTHFTQSVLHHSRANKQLTPQSWGVRRQCVLGAQWLKSCHRQVPRCSGPGPIGGFLFWRVLVFLVWRMDVYKRCKDIHVSTRVGMWLSISPSKISIPPRQLGHSSKARSRQLMC